MSKILIRIGLSLIGKGAVEWVLSEYVYPWLVKLAEKTDNKYDDAAIDYVKNYISQALEMAESDLSK